MLLIVLALLALSIGQASAAGTEPDGEVMLDDIGFDARPARPSGDGAQRDAVAELDDGLAAIDLADLDTLDLDDLDDLDLDELTASHDLDFDEIAASHDLDEHDLDELAPSNDLAAHDGLSGDRVSGDRAADDFPADDLAGDDFPADDLAADDRVTWPATGPTDARAAALARRHSVLGRLDLSLTWRRTESVASARRDEVWLFGAWRL